jgi:hypothetical protein
VFFNACGYCRNNPLRYTDPTGHFWDWVVDAVFVAVDIYNIVTDPGDAMNWASLGVDTACAFIPFVTGGGKALRGATRLADNLDDAVDLSKTIDRGGDLTRALEREAEFTRALEREVELTKTLERGTDITNTLDRVSDVERAAERGSKGGIVYLRTNLETGEKYVGRSKSYDRFLERQVEHNRALDTKHHYDILERARPGTSLRKAEEDWIRTYGGPGKLANRRYEMNAWAYQRAGGTIPRL